MKLQINVTGWKTIYNDPATFRIKEQICSMEINRGNINVTGSYVKSWSFGTTYAPLQTITFLSIDGDCHIKMTPEGECFLKTVSGQNKSIYLKANTTFKIA